NTVTGQLQILRSKPRACMYFKVLSVIFPSLGGCVSSRFGRTARDLFHFQLILRTSNWSNATWKWRYRREEPPRPGEGYSDTRCRTASAGDTFQKNSPATVA